MERNKDMKKKQSKTGAENVRWDLSFLYSGVDDPQIDRDLAEWVAKAKLFNAAHAGILTHTLGQALRAYGDLQMLGDKIAYYSMFLLTLDTDNGAAKTKKTEIDRQVNSVSGDHLEFFKIQIAAMPE